MVDQSSPPIFFYWLSGATTALAAFLIFEIIRLRRYIRRVEEKIDSSSKEIHIIAKA